MPKTIGIIGARICNSEHDYNACADAFWSVYENGDKIVSGGCRRGGDRFAEMLAKVNNIPITIHYANWGLHGKSAGLIRNRDIAHECDVLIAVVTKNPEDCRGTMHTIKCAEVLGKKVIKVSR